LIPNVRIAILLNIQSTSILIHSPTRGQFSPMSVTQQHYFNHE